MLTVEHIRERISEAGLRPTHARVRILQMLEVVKDHPTAEELVERLEPVGRATVYQNLEKLLKVGLARTVASTDGARRYDSALVPHQHFVCARTGRVLDVQVDPELLKRLVPLDPETGKPMQGAKVGEIRVEFRGTSI
jgi:Fur family transcriptional regulator, peroxide stress response regulator